MWKSIYLKPRMKYNFSFSRFFVNATSSIKIIQNVISSVTHVRPRLQKLCFVQFASLCCFTITLVRDLLRSAILSMRLAVLFNIYIQHSIIIWNHYYTIIYIFITIIYIFVFISILVCCFMCFYRFYWFFHISILFYFFISV